MDDETGEVLWFEDYASSGDNHESAYDMVLAANGDAIITGRAYNDAAAEDIVVLRYANADGELLWEKLFGGPANRDDRAWSIVLDPDGNPLLTGLSTNIDETVDFITMKLSAADGRILWQRRISGAYTEFANFGWLLPCANGDVIMMNNLWHSGQSYNIMLQRYAASDGATLWETEYDGATSGSDKAVAMIAGDNGDPVLAGVSGGDMMTLRFDAASGDLLWESFHDGPMGWYDAAECVTLAGDGSILTGGYINSGDPAWDGAVVALDPDDGTELWFISFDGLDSLSDEFRQLVCVGGDLYAVGYSYFTATDMDLLAIRYELPTTSVSQTWTGASTAAAWPNPFSERTSISFASPRGGGDLEAAVYDVRGRLLRRLHQPAGQSGQALIWDGMDASGNAVPAGVYLLRARVGEETFSARVLRLR